MRHQLSALFVLFLGLWTAPVLACTVESVPPDAGLPLDKMESAVVCRVAEVVNDYTTFQLLPSVQVPIAKPLYDFLLDHPALTSNIVRHYNFGNYRVTEISATIFSGEDNEGGDALVTLLYQDSTRRLYHLRGRQRGYVIPSITGAGIVMLTYSPTFGADGRESVNTRVTVFAKLDNRFLAQLAKVFRPILQKVINNKLTKGVRTVHRMTEYLATEPEPVVREMETFTTDATVAQAFRLLLLPRVKKGG